MYRQSHSFFCYYCQFFFKKKVIHKNKESFCCCCCIYLWLFTYTASPKKIQTCTESTSSKTHTDIYLDRQWRDPQIRLHSTYRFLPHQLAPRCALLAGPSTVRRCCCDDDNRTTVLESGQPISRLSRMQQRRR